MEFQGRIAKVLPVRSGVSQRTGNEWKSLPFIFEYFENPTDRFADSVILETFDTKVIDNLKEGMEVRCGFGHRTREYTKQDGTTAIINDLRLYKIEAVRKEQPEQAPLTQHEVAPFPPQQQEGGDADDLPF